MNKDKFDNSDYPVNSPLYDPLRKKNGKYKDEAGGLIIKEFVGLRSKMYKIKHEDYKKTLFNKQQISHTIKTLRSDRINLRVIN